MQDYEISKGSLIPYASADAIQRNLLRVLAVTSVSWNVVSACRKQKRRMARPALRWAW